MAKLESKKQIAVILEKSVPQNFLPEELRRSINNRVADALGGELCLDLSQQEVIQAEGGNLENIKARAAPYVGSARSMGYEVYAVVDTTRRLLEIRLVKMLSEFDSVDVEKLSEQSTAHVKRMAERTVDLCAQFPGDDEKPNWEFDKNKKQTRRINWKELDLVQEKIQSFSERYNADIDGSLREGGNIVFPGNDTDEYINFAESRKVYISPPIEKLHEFLEALMIVFNELGVMYDGWKLHFEWIGNEDKGVVQPHNLVCFYFRNDTKFNLFIQAVREAERRSGVELVRWEQGMYSYGQVLDQKINFGLDTPQLSFDIMNGNFKYALIEECRKLEKMSLSKDEKIRRIVSAGEIFLQKERGVGVESFLAVNPDNIFFVRKFLNNPTYAQMENMDRLKASILPQLTQQHRAMVCEDIESGKEKGFFLININSRLASQ